MRIVVRLRSRTGQLANPARCKAPVGASQWFLTVALALGGAMQDGWAAQCSISVQGVNFGTYDTFSSQNLDSTGNIGVSCDNSTIYSISLSPGSGSYASRAMTSSGHTLTYNVYTDATRVTVWGDGSGGTGIVSGTWAALINHPVYGRVAPRQNAYIGSYSDSITVTLTF